MAIAFAIRDLPKHCFCHMEFTKQLSSSYGVCQLVSFTIMDLPSDRFYHLGFA